MFASSAPSSHTSACRDESSRVHFVEFGQYLVIGARVTSSIVHRDRDSPMQYALIVQEDTETKHRFSGVTGR
jgi:hypothetical protein